MVLTTDPDDLEKLRKSLPPGAEKNAGPLLITAREALEDGQLEVAEHLIQAAVLLDPELGDAWALAARIEDEIGDLGAAEAAYRRAISLRQDEASTLGLARLLASIGRWEEASDLATYLARDGEDRPIQEAAAVLLVQIGARQGGDAWAQ
jgi:Flp pilus assembly protein TadD